MDIDCMKKKKKTEKSLFFEPAMAGFFFAFKRNLD